MGLIMCRLCPMSLRPLLLAPLLALGLTARAEVVKTWDRPLAPGMTFRMEVEANPARTIYGIKFDPKLVRAESWLAGGSIYEEGASNGRAVVSQMVKEAGAHAGFNGDFFQWTPDPGGDPSGFMASKGVLLSAEGRGTRTATWVWGAGSAGRIVRPKAEIKAVSGLISLPIDTLNGKVAQGGIGLSFDVSGEIYGHGPLTLIHLDLNGAKPALSGELKAKVHSVETGITAAPIKKGFAVLAAEDQKAALLAALTPGSEVEIKITVTGMRPGETEAMGGGPILLRRGEYAGPQEDDKAPPHPRTLVGTTPDGMVWSIVVDGRQTMSVGTTHSESAEILRRWGCTEAINLDGGGSSTLHAFGITLNRPSGGVERTVANGVVLFAGQAPTKGPDGCVIQAPASAKVGEVLQLTLGSCGSLGSPQSAIWTCQGAGWIDQDGRLTCHAAGKAEVACFVFGQIIKATVTVTAQ